MSGSRSKVRNRTDLNCSRFRSEQFFHPIVFKSLEQATNEGCSVSEFERRSYVR